MLDKEAYVFKETLRNGTPITLRAAYADDGSRIRQAFKSLDRDTVYTRFLGYKPDVSDAELERITGADFDRDVALLVTTGSGDDELVIGGASYFTVAAGPSARSAEMAFTDPQHDLQRGERQEAGPDLRINQPIHHGLSEGSVVRRAGCSPIANCHEQACQVQPISLEEM